MACSAGHMPEGQSACPAGILQNPHQRRVHDGGLLAEKLLHRHTRPDGLSTEAGDCLLNMLHAEGAQLNGKSGPARHHVHRPRLHGEPAHGTGHLPVCLNADGGHPLNQAAGVEQRVIPQVHGGAARMVCLAGDCYLIAGYADDAIYDTGRNLFPRQNAALLYVQLQIAPVVPTVSFRRLDTLGTDAQSRGPLQGVRLLRLACEGLAAEGAADHIALLLIKCDNLNAVPRRIAALPQGPHSFDTGQNTIGAVIHPAVWNCVNVRAHRNDPTGSSGQTACEIPHGVYRCF